MHLEWCEPAENTFYFSLTKGHSALVQKYYHSILELTQKVLTFYDQCALRSEIPKLGVFNRGVPT